MNWLNWIIASLIVVGAIVARKTMKTWFAPASFFSLCWSVFTIIPMVCAPGYPVFGGGLVYILISCIILFVGSLAANRVYAFGNRSRSLMDGNQDGYLFQHLPLLIIICTIIGLISFCYMCYDIFQSMDPPITPEKISAIRLQIRWSSQYSPPIISRVLNSFIYSGGLLGGINYIVSKGLLKKALSFSPFLAALLYTMTLTTKSAILYPAVLFASTSIATLFYRDNYKASLFHFKYIIGASLISILCMAFMADKIRGATRGDLLSLWAYLKPSFFGHISTFTTWFKDNWHSDFTPALGAYSISGVFDALGIKERLSGIYRDEIMLGKHGTNVYTVFRGLIQDFTLFGSFLVLFVVGFFSQLFFKLATERKRIAIVLLSGFYAFVIWGFVVSIFCYNSIILSFILLFAYILCLEFKKKSSFWVKN